MTAELICIDVCFLIFRFFLFAVTPRYAAFWLLTESELTSAVALVRVLGRIKRLIGKFDMSKYRFYLSSVCY